MALAASYSVKIIQEMSPSSAGLVVGQQHVGYFSSHDTITAFATLTGGAGGTLDVVVEGSFDLVTWYERARFHTVAAATTQTETATSVLTSDVLSIGQSTLLTPGSIVLAQAKVAPGHWGHFLRLKYQAGAGTSAGAMQTIAFVGTTSAR